MSAEPTDRELIITRFRDVRDCTRGERAVLAWSDLAAELTHHARRADKDGRGWAPVTFSDEPCSCGKMKDGKLVCPVERGHRINDNVIAVYTLTLDIDKTYPDAHGKRHRLDQVGAAIARERLRSLGLRHVLHSTHSHNPPENPCYRAVVDLTRPVRGNEYDAFWPAALAYLDIPHDPASKNAARFWYLPSCPPDAEPIFESHDGKPFDVDMVMATARASTAPAARAASKRPTQRRTYVPKPAARVYPDDLMAEIYPGVRCDDHGGGSRRWDIECPWSSEHTKKGGNGDTAVFVTAAGVPGFKCLHGHCEGRTWREFRRFHQPDWVPFDERPTTPVRTNRKPEPEHTAIEPLGADDVPCPGDDDAPPGQRKHKSKAASFEGTVGAAKDYVVRFAMHADGPMLRRWRGDWYRWTPETGRYTRASDERIEATLYRDLGLTRPVDVRDVRAALIGVADILIDEVDLGGWIGNPAVEHSPLDVAACPNGLLYLPSRTLVPATPRHFATTSLGVSYDPAAPRPMHFFTFLSQLWPKDDESIRTLQEWFGYQLTPDTRQQKIGMVLGPRRSGKGTIGRVLRALLGGDSVAAPTLSSLATHFGMWPLIGKIAAILGDVRIGPKTDIVALVERLLSISGEDALTIDRKHREPWTGALSTRITVISNELPRFSDASDALAGRMLIWELGRSFYGEEDTKLTSKLTAELPGILNWAIDGWSRLRERGHFVQPSSSAELVNDLIETGSPVAAWAHLRCDRPKRPHDAQAYEFPCEDAFNDYLAWAGDEGHQHKLTLTMFGRDLKAATGAKRVQVTGGSRVYRGIRLKADAKPYPPAVKYTDRVPARDYDS